MICRHASSLSAPCSSILLWSGCAAMLWYQAGFRAAPAANPLSQVPVTTGQRADRHPGRRSCHKPGSVYVICHVSFGSGGMHRHETSVRSTAGEGEK